MMMMILMMIMMNMTGKEFGGIVEWSLIGDGGDLSINRLT
jgi:hypothetical protein